MTITDRPSAASLAFQEWRRASAYLRAAERRGAPYAELVALSEAVIRTRNTLALQRLAAGLPLPANTIRDELLLDEADDTTDDV